MRTYSPKASEITRAWHVIDADGLVLGRLCTEVARLLRGKHKPTFAPHLDTGDHVIIVNADKVVLTSGKADRKHGLPLLRLPGRPQAGDLRRAAGPQARGGHPPLGPGHAAQGPARPPDARRSSRSTPAPSTRTPPRTRLALELRPAPRLAERREEPIVTKPLTQTTGRRKQAVARVRLRPGTGAIIVNRRPFEDYFPMATHRMISSEPLRLTSTEEVYDVDATLDGGGISGQAGALRLGIARALCELDPELRAHAEEGRPPHPRRPREGEQEVRPEEGPQGAAVLQALMPHGSGASGRDPAVPPPWLRRAAESRPRRRADPPGPPMALRFGTDGVRGVANAELTPELALALGRAAARRARRRPRGDRPRHPPVRARCSRRRWPPGSPPRACDVELVGVVPTPAVAFISDVRARAPAP